MKSFSDATLGEFLRLAASDSPTPGGGGVAALSGCLGAAMLSMVANFTVGREKFAAHDETMRSVLAAVQPLMDAMRAAIDDDAAAFSAISEAYKLPRGDEAEKKIRRAAIDAALTASMLVPLRVLKCSCEAAELLPAVAGGGNPNLLSDVEVAAVMLKAASRAALANVYANSALLKTDAAREAEAEGERIRARVTELDQEVREIIRDRNEGNA